MLSETGTEKENENNEACNATAKATSIAILVHSAPVFDSARPDTCRRVNARLMGNDQAFSPVTAGLSLPGWDPSNHFADFGKHAIIARCGPCEMSVRILAKNERTCRKWDVAMFRKRLVLCSAA